MQGYLVGVAMLFLASTVFVGSLVGFTFRRELSAVLSSLRAKSIPKEARTYSVNIRLDDATVKVYAPRIRINADKPLVSASLVTGALIAADFIFDSVENEHWVFSDHVAIADDSIEPYVFEPVNKVSTNTRATYELAA